MGTIRTFALTHRRLAALVLALALAVRALVPGGFMVGGQGKALAVLVCDGQGGHALVALAGTVRPADDHGGHAGQADPACPYTALAMGSLAAADPLRLAAAVVLLVALALATVPPLAVPRAAHLRPPLRGPPAHP